MPINCTDCHGELDPAYFDTRCRECSGAQQHHAATTDRVDGYCRCKGIQTTNLGHVIRAEWACNCGEWRQKVLRCESCERIAANQESYEALEDEAYDYNR